jgi:acetamidase/formamidase
MTRHVIKASSTTVQRGIISSTGEADPDHRLDTVIFDTWSMWDNAGGPDLTLEKALALRDRFRAENRGPHSLTGPIAVETAEPGDVLKVEIERLEVADHGIYLIPGEQSLGLLADIFIKAELPHFPLDSRNMTAQFGDRVTIPLRPFLGIMGVSPPPDLHEARPFPAISAVTLTVPI